MFRHVSGNFCELFTRDFIARGQLVVPFPGLGQRDWVSLGSKKNFLVKKSEKNQIFISAKILCFGVPEVIF